MKKILKKNKIYVGIIIILIIYFVIFYLFSTKEKKENNKIASIIVDGINGWQYKEQSWNTIHDYDKVTNKKKYKVYSKEEYYGEFYIKNTDNKLYLFDDNYNSLQYTSSILAYEANFNINVLEFYYDTLGENDRSILNDIISSYSNYNLESQKINIDLNKDGNMDTLYILSFFDDNNQSVFSAVYRLNNGKIQEIISSDNMAITYNIEYILDIDEDKKYELILSTSYHAIKNYSIYRQKSNKYIEFLN